MLLRNTKTLAFVPLPSLVARKKDFSPSAKDAFCSLWQKLLTKRRVFAIFDSRSGNRHKSLAKYFDCNIPRFLYNFLIRP